MRLPLGTVKNLAMLLLVAIVLFFVLSDSLRVYLPAILAGIAIILAVLQFYRPQRRNAVLADLKARWGKEDDRERDYEALDDQYQNFFINEDTADSLDNASWIDLNMDEIFTKLDRTHTNPGELMLYGMLRDIVKTPDLLEARQRAIRRIETNPKLQETMLLSLHRLGRDSAADLVGLLWGKKQVRLGLRWLYNLLAVVAVLSLLLCIPFGGQALMLISLPIFLINSLLSLTIVRGDVLVQAQTLRYLRKVIETACDLSSLDEAELLPWTTEMTRVARATNAVARKIRFLNPESKLSTEIFTMAGNYLSAFFLTEIRTFNRVMDDIDRLRDDLKTVVRLVGELDALQSAASFRSGLPHYCEPEFIDGNPSLNIEDGWHPLVSAPVPNSLRSDGENLFVTGSNMAGKSTFLRMVAVNVILAQTLYTCCAHTYRATRFRLTSSISHGDEIMSGTSYFLAESRRLLHVLRCAETDGMPFLCLIDEMLRGTNSVERHAASLAILRQLAQTSAVIIVASHDTELGQMLKGSYALYHFAESFKEDRMVFDYQLKSGVCGIGNAIRTLDYLGYPGVIIGDAREHLARIQTNGGIYRTVSEITSTDPISPV